MDLEKLKEAKKKAHLTIAEIAERANLPKGTVQNIFCGYVPNPRSDTLEAIERALGLRVTDEERAAGVTDRIRVWITPEEDELLMLFREMGEKNRNAARQTLIQLARELVK